VGVLLTKGNQPEIPGQILAVNAAKGAFLLDMVMQELKNIMGAQCHNSASKQAKMLKLHVENVKTLSAKVTKDPDKQYLFRQKAKAV
jgi:hypothetical protein